MKLCADVAVIAAWRHAESRVVTLAVDGVLFRTPVKVSEVLTLKATVNAAWRSSMEVTSGWRPRICGEEPSHTLTAYVTMVALDECGKPVAVPTLSPETAEDRRRWHEANRRRRIRLADPSELQRRLQEAVDSD